MVEVRKRENETIPAMLRRFTRRVQLSGVLINARKHHFYAPKPKKRFLRERALRRVIKIKAMERMKKLGKLIEGDK